MSVLKFIIKSTLFIVASISIISNVISANNTNFECSILKENQFNYDEATCSLFTYDTNYFANYLKENQINNELKINEKRDHTLAIVVPFRDRFDELQNFVPSISKYLNKKSIKFKIYIINQADDLRFNRASLINVGFLASQNECDYMAMHDVDLVPLNMELDYSYPIEGPYHVASPDLHPKYNYAKFIGGILIINKKHFLTVNGMSNKFWGWGREDDEFYMRLKNRNYKINRPNKNKIKTNSENTFKHDHCPHKRKRDSYKYEQQKIDSFRFDFDTGLDTIQYRIIDRVQIQINNYSCTIINVKLYCDKAFTPWCEHQYKFFN